ncbi:hypothetical protein BDN70DRAFT_819444 [Pholiota conissans]|uniref:Uncharacterized protein n=1 Tax=Pholiota conissans TaxID=109636 RepID=A0A9P6CM43_9AGAR|nr:hypothetical protein BDN70DRAFT_819444 [Pholiota conissans]
MEKAIFLDYSPGYKGWQFHNLVIKKFIISEYAVFDKCSFSGLAVTTLVNLMPICSNSELQSVSFVPESRKDEIESFLVQIALLSADKDPNHKPAAPEPPVPDAQADAGPPKGLQ